MAAVDVFKGWHFTVATDSLGGATIGRVTNYEFTFATNAEPSYQLVKSSSSSYINLNLVLIIKSSNPLG